MSKKFKPEMEPANDKRKEFLILEKFGKIQEIIFRKKYSYIELFKERDFAYFSIEENLENKYLRDLESLSQHILDLKTELDKNTLKSLDIRELKENFLALYKKCQRMENKHEISASKHEDFTKNIKPLIQYLGKKEMKSRESNQSRRE